MTSLRKILISAALPVLAFFGGASTAEAYDFAARNAFGISIYYNIIDNESVEVTYGVKFNEKDPYKGSIHLPGTVWYDGVSYKVTAIGDLAFFNCPEVTSVTLSSYVTTIGMWAFGWCDALETITLTPAVQQIGANAFDGCFALTNIKVQSSNPYLASVDGVLFDKARTEMLVFPAGLEGAYTLPTGTLQIAPSAFYGSTFLKSVELGNTLTTIGDNAFYFCNHLETVNIPASVTSIGTTAFGDCFSLESINVDEANPEYSSSNGVLMSKDGTRLIQSPGASIGTAHVPDGVQVITDQAFLRNYSITTVKLPKSLNEIGDAAFIDCPSLTSIEIPSATHRIGKMAFAMDGKLQSVYSYVAEPSSITVDDAAFESVPATCVLYVPAGSVDKYKASEAWGAFTQVEAFSDLIPQTIEWEEANDQTLANGFMKLSASTSSGMPVTYVLSPTSQGSAIINGDTVEIVDTGYIAITAVQPGNSVFAPAEPVTHVINPGSTGVEDAATSAVSVYGGNSCIIIRGADADVQAVVYDIEGRMVYSGKDRTIPVAPHNIYVVRVGRQSYKVAVL